SRVDIFERVSLLFDVDICQLIYRFYGTILFSMTLRKRQAYASSFVKLFYYTVIYL
ncbi:MAG: hypothetical protein PWP30_1780, partial [Eubacteriaceae bacterium]|nr:hypothetical protein [Eubacteriaceae bacterium]